MKLQQLSLATRISLAAMAFVIGTALVLVAVVTGHQRDKFLAQRGAELGDRVRQNGARLNQVVETLRRDVLFLSRTPPVSGILRARLSGGLDLQDGQPGTMWEKRLKEIFSAFAEAHPDYFRLRYIGVADGGREIVRVERRPEGIRVAADAELQAAGAGDDFRAAVGLPAGAVHLSEIERNREWGRDGPELRALRAATPVFSSSGRLFGIVIVDLDVGALLDGVASGLPSHIRAYVTDARGHYLAHPDPSRAFAFARSLQEDYPALEAVFSGAKDHQPLHAVPGAQGRQHLTIQRVRLDPLRPERFLLLAYAMPEAAVAEEVAPARQQAILIAVTSTLLALIVLLLVLNRTFAPLRQLTEAAGAIAEGRYAVSLPRGTGGELCALVQAFRVMLGKVSERERDFVRLNEELEERVRARTAELSASEASLRAKEAELSLAASVFHNTLEGVIVTDAQATILSVNPAFTEITGYTAEEAVGRKPSLFRSDHYGPEFYRQMWEALLREGRWQGELWNRRKNGEAFFEALTITQVATADGRPLRYVGVFHDITELRRKDERIRHLAFHDALTGLPNRALLLDRLEHAIAGARRDRGRLSLLFVDLDRFKAINDTLGHDVGDGLLQEVAERLANCVRHSDTVARMGGDEFVLLLEHLEAQAAAGVAKKLLAELGRPMSIDGHAIQVGASVGIACHPDDGADAVTLMKHADAAMYEAKSAGRGTYRFFQAAMTDKAVKRLRLEMELRQAVHRGELELFYQPKICLGPGTACGLEALVRWRHPVLGLVPPGDFIPVAEETGLIGELGDWVLQEACRQAGAWQLGGPGRIRIAVNVSAKQLQRGDLVERISQLAAAHGISPADLEIELTESVIMANPEHAASVFARLRAIGVSIAMDDFGTGYSSLAHLRRLPIDVLKIDRSFVMNVERDEGAAEIVRTILALGQTLKLTVVAEGVETRAQAEFLKAAGCAMAQGYLYARPEPAARIEEWLRSHRGCAVPS